MEPTRHDTTEAWPRSPPDAAAVALEHGLPQGAVPVQGHLLVLRPHQVVDDVAAAGVPPGVAEPPLAHVAADEGGGEHENGGEGEDEDEDEGEGEGEDEDGDEDEEDHAPDEGGGVVDAAVGAGGALATRLELAHPALLHLVWRRWRRGRRRWRSRRK